MPSTPTRKPPLRKRTSYSYEQDGDLQATNPPTRGWGTGSYDMYGRPTKQQTALTRTKMPYGEPGNGTEEAGRHTLDEMTQRGPVKGTTPGRW
jgi:hypothetical protein